MSGAESGKSDIKVFEHKQEAEDVIQGEQMFGLNKNVNMTHVGLDFSSSGGIYTSEQIKMTKHYFEYKNTKEALESKRYYETTNGEPGNQKSWFWWQVIGQ